eukprot:2931999-Prorocentrum_lima.AAC.1
MPFGSANSGSKSVHTMLFLLHFLIGIPKITLLYIDLPPSETAPLTSNPDRKFSFLVFGDDV